MNQLLFAKIESKTDYLTNFRLTWSYDVQKDIIKQRWLLAQLYNLWPAAKTSEAFLWLSWKVVLNTETDGLEF